MKLQTGDTVYVDRKNIWENYRNNQKQQSEQADGSRGLAPERQDTIKTGNRKLPSYRNVNHAAAPVDRDVPFVLEVKELEGGIQLRKGGIFAMKPGAQSAFDHYDGTYTIEVELSDEAYDKLRETVDWQDGAWQSTVSIPGKYKDKNAVDAMEPLKLWEMESGDAIRQKIMEYALRRAGSSRNANSVNLIVRAPGVEPKNSIEQHTQTLRDKIRDSADGRAR